MDGISAIKYIVRLLSFSALLLPFSVHADEYHYNNILTGDRPAGMGGAYVAISDDTSGLFYNPAGIVHATGNNISGSMSALHQASTTYRGALGGSLDWKRTSSVLLPNYFGVFQTFGKGKIGFSYAVTDSIQEDQDQTFRNIPGTTVSTYIINYNNQDTTYNIGPGYAHKINNHLSAGISLYGYFHSSELIKNQLAYTNNDTDYEWNNRYRYSEESGINPVLGLMWEPKEKFSIGVSLRRIFILSSETSTQVTCKGDGTFAYDPASFCQSNVLNRNEFRNTGKGDYPFELRTGIAWFKNERRLFSADLSFHTSTDGDQGTPRTQVLNISLGAELYLNSNWALRTGFYTNFANTPDLQTTGVTSVQADHVDMFGGSISISHFSRDSVLSVGMNLMVGNGKAQLFNPDSSGNATLQDVESTSMSFFLSASHAY